MQDDGSTENATVATTLLANVVERGRDVEQGVLVVIDGAKALRKAIRDVLGVHMPVQRCVRQRSEASLVTCPSATGRSSEDAGGLLRVVPSDGPRVYGLSSTLHIGDEVWA